MTLILSGPFSMRIFFLIRYLFLVPGWGLAIPSWAITLEKNQETSVVLSSKEQPSLTQQKNNKNIFEFHLHNGMKIIVKPDHRAPTVVHMVWYRVGSVDEKTGTTGVSHALEHMMFKGSKKLKPGEFSQQVAELGGRENAFTTQDYTAYFQQIPSNRLARVMELEADRMQNLVISKKEFAKEIKVVMEERRWRTDDRAQARVHEAFMAILFQTYPYRVPVIGWMQDLQNMTDQDVRAWYEAWYAPNNVTLIVTGDVEPQVVFRLAQKIYGKIKAYPLPPRKEQTEILQTGIRRVEVKAPAENAYFIMGYHVPGLRHLEEDEPYALAVLAAVLDGYPGARLETKLVREQRIANEIGAEYDLISRGPAVFIFQGVPATGKTTADIEAAIKTQVQRIAEEGISAQELSRVKTQLIASQIYKRDSIFAQAMEIGQYEMSGFTYQDIEHVIEKLKTVTASKVQNVAKKYFKDDQLTIAVLIPQPIDPIHSNKPPHAPEGLHH